MTRPSSLANSWITALATYEPGRPIEETARELGFASSDGIIKLASNENALGPSPLAVEAMRRKAADMHRYPDGGAYYLKQALARKLDIDPENILPSNGSNEAIELLSHVFLGPGKAIVVGDLAFVVYKLIAALFMADVISVPMRNFTNDLDAMLDAINADTRLLFIGNPNNPTSTMVDEDAIDRFMANVPSHTIVCFDEAYVELLPPSEQPDTIKYAREGRNVVVLRTFSKTYGLAGLRLGYTIAPKNLIELLNRVRQPFNVNSAAMAAAIAALSDEEHVERTRAMVKQGLMYLEHELTGLGLSYAPPKANFVLIDVGRGREVFNALLAGGIIVRPMDAYGLPRHVRVTVGTREENEAFIAALRAVLKTG